MRSSYSALDCISWNRLIAYYSFIDLKHVKWVKIVISAYERFSLYPLAFVVVCLFFHFSSKRDILNFRVMAVRDIELPGLCKFVQNNSRHVSLLGNLTDLKIGEAQSLLISYNIAISWLYPLNGFRIIFYCFRIALQYNPRVVLLGSTHTLVSFILNAQ